MDTETRRDFSFLRGLLLFSSIAFWSGVGRTLALSASVCLTLSLFLISPVAVMFSSSQPLFFSRVK